MAARLLGLDVGTSVIKAVVFDLVGTELSAASEPIEVQVPQPGWAEQDMDDVWAAAARSITAALAPIDAADVAAVAVAGQGDGAWLIDAGGAPVAPAPLWNDGRASDVIEGWLDSGALSRLFERGGTVLWPGSQAALLAWFSEHDPEILERATTVFCSKDWVRFRLTGTIGTDETDGSIPFMDLASRAFDDGQLELLGLTGCRALLPPVSPSHEVVGEISAEAAGATGLRVGTPVVAGLLDVAANAVGVGAIEAGQAMVTLGTTAISAAILDRPAIEPVDIGASVCHAPPGRWLRALGTMAGTPNVDWYLKSMAGALPAEAERTGRDVFELLEQSMAASAPGAGGVVYHPYLLGERVPFLAPEARAAFFGLSASTSQADLARAVAEGVAYAVRHCFEAAGVPVREVRLSGGGARSETWSEILASVTGATMRVASGSQFGALGAAIAAGVGIGLYPDYAGAIARCVRGERVHEPSAEQMAVYDRRYGAYVELIEAMRTFWPRLT